MHMFNIQRPALLVVKLRLHSESVTVAIWAFNPFPEPQGRDRSPIGLAEPLLQYLLAYHRDPIDGGKSGSNPHHRQAARLVLQF